MLSSKEATNVEAQYTVEHETYVNIWDEFIRHMVRLGYAIKMAYLISEYDGISMLRDVLKCFSEHSELSGCINLSSDEARKILKILFNENVGYFLAKLSLASALTSNVERLNIVDRIIKHKISEKTNNLLIELSGVNYNDINLSKQGIKGFKTKLAVLSNILASICDIALGVYGK